MDVVQTYIDNLQMIIGNPQFFKTKSLTAQFVDVYRDLQLFRKINIQEVKKKLEFVHKDLSTQDSIRKRNFVKKDLRAMLNQFFMYFQNFEKRRGNEDVVARVVELLRQNAEKLNEVSKRVKEGRTFREVLAESVARTRENKEVLDMLKVQIEKLKNAI